MLAVHRMLARIFPLVSPVFEHFLSCGRQRAFYLPAVYLCVYCLARLTARCCW